jgi:hypothetical protein
VVRPLLPPVGRAQQLCTSTLEFPLRARRTGFYHRVGAPTGPSLGAPAFILSLVALFLTPLLQRGLRNAPLLRCAGASVVRP